MGLHASRVVQAFAYYVAMGFVACELTFFLACRPFTGYWAVPPPDRKIPERSSQFYRWLANIDNS